MKKICNNKLTILGRNIYQEVVLVDTFSDGVIIGTTSASKIRFDKKDFFADFQIDVFRQDNHSGWNIGCGDNIYIQSSNATKLYFKELEIGEDIVFCYDSSDAELLRILFSFDFESIKSNYQKKIDIYECDNLCIGGPDFCKIQLKSDLIGEDFITFTKQRNGYIANINNAKYGVNLNGVQCRDYTFSINDYDFLMFDGYKMYYYQGYLYVDSKDKTISTHLPCTYLNKCNNVFEYPKYVKNARIQTVIGNEDINILPPDKKPEENEENILLTIMPSVIMLIAMLFLRSKMSGNKMFVIYMGVTMGIGIITSILTHRRQIKKGKAQILKREEVYTRYLMEKEQYIKNERKIEWEQLENVYIDQKEEMRQVREFDYRLFEKSMDDDDFLTLRVGKGDVEARRKIVISNQEHIETDDPLVEYPNKLLHAYSSIKNVPVLIDLKELSVLGILGKREYLFEILKNLTLDIVVRHFYDDVKMYYIFDERDQNKFMPFRWLKNLSSFDSSLKNMIYNDESRKILLENMYKELSWRETLDTKIVSRMPYYVVFVYNSKGLSSHPVSKYLGTAKDLRFIFVYFEEERELIPRQTDKLIQLFNSTEGVIIDTKDSNNSQKFEYTTIKDEELSYVTRRLGCVFVENVSLENSLEKNVSLFKLLGIISVSDLDIERRWTESQVYKSMAAPIGLNALNEIVELDINEKAHGPHGLVAGTTGSGKSEILQTYILSLATLFHPYDVSFVIIDFKGGGMVNQFKNLPHLNGAITNIDGDAVNRSLSSIRAELRKRQSLFAEYDVNHIDAYIKKYKAGVALIPLPHLILIVDEFAELKLDQPEFMQELISTARIGRSLGVHMILATQKPAGVVNDQIWSNSRFKICLKVQNKSDSNEVIKSPLAAEIREPGRAYLQVGNNEIFELFQSAYSGYGIDTEQSGKMKEYEIKEIDLAGLGKIVFEQKNESKQKMDTQLEAIVNYIAQYCDKNAIVKLPGICLPELPEVIVKDLSQYEIVENESDICVEIGKYDDPDNQEQGAQRLNVSQNHTLIIGAPQYGKTNILQQILKELAMQYSASEVNVYILDFASMSLKLFGALNIVGGVVTASDDEKMSNFFRMMMEEIVKRKESFSGLGIGSFSAYKEAGYTEFPQIIIIIDNFMGLKEVYLQREDYLLKIVREGITLGISVIITDVQVGSLGFKYLSLFSNKLALYCNNENEYNSLFGSCRNKLKTIPGRALIDKDKKVYYIQTYLAFEGEKEIDRIKNMKDIILTANLRSFGCKAKRIPEVPDVFNMDIAIDLYDQIMKKSYTAIWGLDYNTANPATIDFMDSATLAIVTRDLSVNYKLSENILLQLLNNVSIAPIELYFVDDYQSKYKKYEEYKETKKYTTEAEKVLDYIDDLEEYCDYILNERKNSIMQSKIYSLKLLVVNNRECFEILNKKRDYVEKFKKILTKYKNLPVFIMFVDFENLRIPFSGADIQKTMLEYKYMIIIEDINKIKMFDVSIQTQREFTKSIGKTDGYLWGEDGIKKYKLLL